MCAVAPARSSRLLECLAGSGSTAIATANRVTTSVVQVYTSTAAAMAAQVKDWLDGVAARQQARAVFRAAYASIR